MGMNLQATRQTYEKRVEERGGANYWKPKDETETMFRVLPHTLRYFTEEEGLNDNGFMYYLHYGVGPEGAEGRVICPKTGGKNNRCPVCEEAARLRKLGDPASVAEANEVRQTRKYLLNIIDLSDPKETAKGIQVWDAPSSAHDEIIKWCNERWGDPFAIGDEPDAAVKKLGRNLILYKKVPAGNKRRTEYKIEPDSAPSSVAEHLPKDWKAGIKKLETMIPKFKTFDEIVAEMSGNVEYGTQGGAANGAQPDAGPAAQAAPAAAATVQKEPEKIVDPAAGGQPKCFGASYSVRSEKCKACGQMIPCKKEFLGEK
jgi:hypothetical protein